MEGKFCLVFSFVIFINGGLAVPPEACFANFRWDDCGKPPVPVMYYWKPGSRCEVGLWRGCLPNLNMFQDEYECVSTCIFTIRAMPEDYHNLLNVPDEQGLETVPPETSHYESTTAGHVETTGTAAGEGNTGGTGGTGGEGTGGTSDAPGTTGKATAG